MPTLFAGFAEPAPAEAPPRRKFRPADPAALAAIGAAAVPRAELSGTHVNMLKSTDLFRWGYSVSHWLNPRVRGAEVCEYNPQFPGLPRLTAATYAEQVAIHKALGAPVLPSGRPARPAPVDHPTLF
jgi:hypothetical protein